MNRFQSIKNIVINFIENNTPSIFNKSTPTSLGRWSIDKCTNKTSLSTYYNNIDHCGSCDYSKKYVENIIYKDK